MFNIDEVKIVATYNQQLQYSGQANWMIGRRPIPVLQILLLFGRFKLKRYSHIAWCNANKEAVF